MTALRGHLTPTLPGSGEVAGTGRVMGPGTFPGLVPLRHGGAASRGQHCGYSSLPLSVVL